MAIGSVKELIDYERETIKIAKKHGGGSVDLSLIADEYDETQQYPYNDMVIHDNKLYKATTAVNTPGAFDETMWTEYLSYDPSNTYNTGDYATYEVDGDNKCFRCDEDNVTGEWDNTKWTDVSDLEFPSYNYANSSPYYPNVSKVALRYPGSYRYFIANSTYAPTGGAGAWNSEKWTETTVEAVINSLPKMKSKQICSTADMATDANGFLTNNLALPENFQLKTIVSVEPQGNMPALMQTYLVQYFVALVNGQHTLKVRLLDTAGLPLASKSAGTFTDAGILTLFYFD